MSVGPLNAGTGTIQLDVNGAITVAAQVESRHPDRGTARLDLVTTGIAGDIGSNGLPITTEIDGELTATTNDGGVNIADSGPG